MKEKYRILRKNIMRMAGWGKSGNAAEEVIFKLRSKRLREIRQKAGKRYEEERTACVKALGPLNKDLKESQKCGSRCQMGHMSLLSFFLK